MSDKSAAVLTLFKPGTMTPKGRKAIAEWLRKQADTFEKDGKAYSKTRFTARYLYK